MISKRKYQALHSIDTSSVYAEIKNALGSKSRTRYELSIPLAAFALYEMSANPNTDYSNIEEFQIAFMNDEMGDFIPCYTTHHMIEEGYANEEDGPWKNIVALKNRFSTDEFAACALFGDKSNSLNDIPLNMNELINGVLEINKEDRVLNYFAEGSSYLISSKLEHGNTFAANFTFPDYAIIAFIRLKLIGQTAWLADPYDLPYEKYNKIFCQFLLASSYEYGVANARYQRSGKQDIPLGCSLEWKIASVILDKLVEGGKAALVIRKNVLSNRRDSIARECFLRKGYIEQIICLPEKLYANRGKTVLIILSYNNEAVTFSDLSTEKSVGRLKGKSIDVLDQRNITNMLKMLTTGANSIAKTNQEIINGNLSLDPRQYLATDSLIECDRFETLSSLGLQGKRAAQLTALDIVSEEETSIQCLMPKNIKDGVVVKPFSYISEEFSDKVSGFSLQSGDILISKNGNPFKVAVYEHDDAGTVIANGNLYIIHGNYAKADSYYIKAFFESNKGIALLNAYSKGNTVPMITLNALMNIPIPYYDADKRHQIAVKCEELSKDIQEMYQSIVNERNELKDFF